MSTTFRDRIAETFDLLATGRSTYVAHAATADGIVHLAELTIRSFYDLALFLPCRHLVIDGQAEELTDLLRRTDVLVDCMTCLVRR